MQPYQNYLTNQQMNPYPYNQPINPQQRLMQLEQQYPQFAQQNQFMQQPVQQNQPQGIVGKIVNDFSELTANDVPMNSSAAFFPKADGSEIQARAWTANGTIQTVVYRPVQPESTAEGANTPQMDFNALNEDVRALREDIKGVKEMIEKSMSVQTPKVTSSRSKKEANANE